jgi:hypothetical protein
MLTDRIVYRVHLHSLGLTWMWASIEPCLTPPFLIDSPGNAPPESRSTGDAFEPKKKKNLRKLQVPKANFSWHLLTCSICRQSITTFPSSSFVFLDILL